LKVLEARKLAKDNDIEARLVTGAASKIRFPMEITEMARGAVGLYMRNAELHNQEGWLPRENWSSEILSV
jgi:hypothetical protein